MTTVISVENLSKVYRLGQIGTGTFSRDLNMWWARARGKSNQLLRIGETDHGNIEGEDLWALNDVSFNVEKGEVLGIIGKNGAGKSTLLKILSRVTAPTSGKIKVKGRIASLLEVGTGFHPELTGRENIYLNGAILGMSRKEIDSKFDEIVNFAEIEKFIDTPVKRYSSGMYVRLAFAVAAHLEPEILLVDEVLAVGDADFQKKCLGKMGEVAKEGRTVLFVSHNMAAIRNLCNRAILIQRGQIGCDGDVADTIASYHHFIHQDEPIQSRRRLIEFSNVRLNQKADFLMHSGDPIELKFNIDFDFYPTTASFWFIIEDIENNTILHHRIEHHQLFNSITKGIYGIIISLPALWLRSGVYSIYIKVLTDVLGHNGHFLSDRWMIDVQPSDDISSLGMVNPPIVWTATPVNEE